MSTTLPVHRCRESSNPRHAGYCDCGRRIPEPDARSDRNPETERLFLYGAEQRAGLDVGWAERVMDRVLQMERSKGNSYQKLGFWRCVLEAEEEGLDLGGWPMMAFLLSFVEFADDEELGLEVRELLQEMAACGVRVTGIVEQLRALL